MSQARCGAFAFVATAEAPPRGAPQPRAKKCTPASLPCSHVSRYSTAVAFGEGAPLSAWGGARRPGGAAPVLASRLLQRMPGNSLRIHAARDVPFRDPRAGRDPPKVFWNPSLRGIVKLAATEMRVLVLGETLAGRVIVHGTWLAAAGKMAQSLAPAAVWSPPTFPLEAAGRNLPATPSRRLPSFAIR